MPKNKVSEWSVTASSNTDIGGININEGCPPSGINNAIRELMAQVRDMQLGADGDGLTVAGLLVAQQGLDLTGNLTASGDLSVSGSSSFVGTATMGKVLATSIESATTTSVLPITGNVTGNVTGNLISVTNTVNAGSFIVGNTYVIASLGSPTTTDFVAIGAASNTIGVQFVATGAGAGDGTATTVTGRAVNVSGIVAVANGGTGVTSSTVNSVLVGNGTGAITSVRPGANNNVLRSTAGSTVTAGSFVVGVQYTILTVGTTDFTLIGAASNTVGVVFIASGVGTGDGTATTNVWDSSLLPSITRGTSQATTSGTSFDFTGIPSWAKRITVMFNQVSLDASEQFLVQLGDAGGIETTGYASRSSAAGSNNTSTAGFIVRVNGTSNLVSGIMTIANISGNVWVGSHALDRGANDCSVGGGSKTLSDVLTQIRITATNDVGGANFDAGSVNILYE
jgi:hypothetical protein